MYYDLDLSLINLTYLLTYLLKILQTINLSINQSINQFINQSINQPINKPTNQSFNQNINIYGYSNLLSINPLNNKIINQDLPFPYWSLFLLALAPLEFVLRSLKSPQPCR